MSSPLPGLYRPTAEVRARERLLLESWRLLHLTGEPCHFCARAYTCDNGKLEAVHRGRRWMERPEAAYWVCDLHNDDLCPRCRSDCFYYGCPTCHWLRDLDLDATEVCPTCHGRGAYWMCEKGCDDEKVPPEVAEVRRRLNQGLCE